MQADELREFRETNALAMTRNLFEDGKGAAQRLNAAALAIFRLIVDIGLAR